MNDKIKILVIPSDRSGVGFFRSLRPHTKMKELFPEEFDIDIVYDFDWSNLDEIKKYNIINFHRGLYADMSAFRNALSFCKENNIKTIMDIDDYWDVGPYHPQYHYYKNTGLGNVIKENLKLVDYVTTTTTIFADEIKKHNPNVKVFVNAIDPNEEQFIPKDKKSDKIRFGFIMGSSHYHDMEMLKGMVNRLSQDVRNKIQFVLCGYDLRGTVTYRDENGEFKQRPILPQESVWWEYEKIVTDNYNIVSPTYRDWLLKFVPNATYAFADNESYKRCWTKDISEYCTHYNDIDVLIVPLLDNKFNMFKSELKLIESGMMNKAVIASDFGPYKIGTINFFEKGGTINKNGNCILIDKTKAHKDWSKAIEKLVKNPEYINILKNNLHNSVKDKYDLSNVTKERAEFYKSLMK